MFQFSSLPPLSLYIHFPWCTRKCPYCDFNSHEVKGTLQEKEYIDALIADLEHELPNVWGRSIKSIFMGGGTPSLFSPEAIDRLLCALRARLNINPDIEITLEANPGSAEQQKFAEFKAAGINRLSLGVQTFSDDKLQRLGRVHNRKEAIQAAEMAHAAGFDNFNIDLMFGLPGQDHSQALSDVQNACDLEPAHISHYQLTIEPHTFFHQNPPTLPGDDVLWEMQNSSQSYMQEQGYLQYEISAYAKTDKQCVHNINYWQFGDYMGIGAGAHGKITNAQQQQIQRYWKEKHPVNYMEGTAEHTHVRETQTLDADNVCLEFMMNALRLTDGFSTTLFSSHTGLPIALLKEQLELAQDKGWLNWTEDKIKPTEQGQRFLNDLLQLFMPT